MPQLPDGRVFRYFADDPTFYSYISGNWKGAGIHGLPDLPLDTTMQCVFVCNKQKELMIDVLSIKKNNKFKLFNFFSKKQEEPIAGFAGVTTKTPFVIKSKILNGQSSFEVDLFTLDDAVYLLMIQAMSDVSIHAVLKDKINNRLIFSGTMEKKKF